jgi:hypothetical protein
MTPSEIDPATFRFVAQCLKYIYMVNYGIYVCTRESNLNPDSNTPETDRPHHGLPPQAACVIAQQYSARFKIMLFQFFYV